MHDPADTVKFVTLVARGKILAVCADGTRTLATFTPTNCLVGTNTYLVWETMIGPPR
jgi:hypothetical protein